MLQEIADAFGLHPESLHVIEDDEHVLKAEHCQSCEAWAKKYAALEVQLDACRKDVELLRAASSGSAS